MEKERTKREESIGQMRRRRETMADGRRYIIYYTFENAAETEKRAAKIENAAEEAEENV